MKIPQTDERTDALRIHRVRVSLYANHSKAAAAKTLA